MSLFRGSILQGPNLYCQQRQAPSERPADHVSLLCNVTFFPLEHFLVASSDVPPHRYVTIYAAQVHESDKKIRVSLPCLSWRGSSLSLSSSCCWRKRRSGTGGTGSDATVISPIERGPWRGGGLSPHCHPLSTNLIKLNKYCFFISGHNSMCYRHPA